VLAVAPVNRLQRAPRGLLWSRSSLAVSNPSNQPTRHANKSHGWDGPTDKVMHMATRRRGAGREHKLTLRLSPHEVEELRRTAADEGYSSLQQLFESRLFGEARPRRKPGPKPQNEQLGLSA